MPVYTLNKETKIEEKGGNFVEAGIRENLSYSRVRYGESAKGNKFIALYFKDLSGAEVPKTEWEPKGATDDELNTKIKKQMKRINHMLVTSGILQEEDLNIKSTDFEDFANKLIAVLDKKADINSKFRAKVVYDNNNFTTLPNYSEYKFIEPMSVSAETSKLRILGIDKINRIKPDAIITTVNPFELENTTEASNLIKEDAPF